MALEKPWLIDTHCHIDGPSFDAERPALLQRMQDKRIFGITIGTTLGNSERAITLAEQHEGIWASVGLHPEHLSSSFHDPEEGERAEKTFDRERLERIARSSSKVVAIGETGIDLYRIDADRPREEAQAAQESSFIAHLEVAEALGLPVVIHCREALGRLAELLEERLKAGHVFSGVVHSFTGTLEEAERLLGLGCYIALNGIATFPPKKTADPARSLDRTIERIPLDRLLLETDSPFLAPVPHRGERNEPTWVEDVATYIAEKRGIPLDLLAKTTTDNAYRLFTRLGER
ncbi:TatD family hydrolase [Patescibacteria group bacterium]|nr:TatD family hydrolase [Patescibacteria group bacterium]